MPNWPLNTLKMDTKFFEQQELEDHISRTLAHILKIDDPKAIDGAKILSMLVTQHGFISKRTGHTYAFTHLTFQEYFTAKYIVQNDDLEILRLLMSHISDTQWREVLFLTASLYKDTRIFFIEMDKAIDNLLIGNEVRNNLTQWLTYKSQKSSFLKPRIARSLYLTLAIKQHDCLTNNLEEKDFAYYQSTINLIGQAIKIQHDAALSFFLNYCKSISNAIKLDYGLALSRLSVQYNIFDHYEDQPRNEFKNIFFDFRLAFYLIILELILKENRQPAYYVKLSQFISDLQQHRDRVSSSFCEALAEIGFPDQHAQKVDWNDFRKRLQTLSITQRGIGFHWDLSESDIMRINQYYSAQSVLLDIMKSGSFQGQSNILEG